MDEKWLKDISRSMEQLEMTPPEGLWEGIEQAVRTSAPQGMEVKGGNRTARIHLWSRVSWAAAVVLLLIGGAALYLLRPDEEQIPVSDALAEVEEVSSPEFSHVTADGSNPSVSTGSSQSGSDSSSLSVSTGSSRSESGGSSLLASAGSSQTTLSCLSSSSSVEASRSTLMTAGDRLAVHDVADDDVFVAASDVDAGAVSSDKVEESRDEQRDGESRAGKSRSEVQPKQRALYDYTPQNRKQSVKRGVRIGLMASNAFLGEDSRNGQGMVTLSSSIMSSPVEKPLVAGSFGSFKNNLLGHEGAKIFDEEKHHKQPLKFGVMCNLPLTDRLSVGTGLYYSGLSSDFITGSEHSYHAIDQKLHYLGIPLQLSYSYYQNSRWQLYASAGGLVEKCVSGKADVDYVVQGNQQSSEHLTVEEKRFQYGVQGALGVQVKLAKILAFYVEPGLTYHFDNHSSVVNIYKDQPLQFSLGVGLRFLIDK